MGLYFILINHVSYNKYQTDHNDMNEPRIIGQITWNSPILDDCHIRNIDHSKLYILIQCSRYQVNIQT